MDIISVVIPFLNEESCIVNFCEYIDAYALNKPYEIEVLFVDDGSTDRTIERMSRFLFHNCLRVKIISLSKNFGSHAAIRAGILYSTGNYCTFMGADLQEPEDMLDVMYNKITSGYDVVYIEKKTGGTNIINRVFSIGYASLMRRFAVKNYGAGGINSLICNEKIKDYLNANIELNSSLLLQIVDAGFKNATISMDYRRRKAGKSKWTVLKKIKLFIDSFVAFSYAPIRLVSIVGISMSLIGFLFGLGIIINKLVNPSVPAGYATLASLILIGFGITNISLGIVAEYLWRTYDAARRRPAFIVSEIKELK